MIDMKMACARVGVSLLALVPFLFGVAWVREALGQTAFVLVFGSLAVLLFAAYVGEEVRSVTEGIAEGVTEVEEGA